MPLAVPVPETAIVASGGHADLPTGVFALVLERGPESGLRFLLAGQSTYTMGRGPDCDIFLDDVTVSRAHATLEAEGAAWRLTDSGSLNGTYVNGRRCTSGVLAAGDTVTVGKFHFRVQRGSES